jgi:site-specific recombinase XerD
MDSVEVWAEQFLFDRKSQNMSAGTLQYYQVKMRKFLTWCADQAIDNMHQLTATDLRRFMTYLEEQGHNPGGRLALYRAIKAFLRWYELEAEPEGWRNPIEKVRPPIVASEPLEPVSAETIRQMLEVCPKKEPLGARDRALLLALLDTGARAAEILAIDLLDIDLVTGSILIRSGKGRKPRTVFLGRQSRKALRAYLRLRQDTSPAVWVTLEGDRLTYWGLRHIIRRRAEQAGVKTPGLHDFRRAFALSMLRNGVDLITLSRLMGHSGLVVLQRYLRQTTEDIEAAHRRAGPVDKANL